MLKSTHPNIKNRTFATHSSLPNLPLPMDTTLNTTAVGIRAAFLPVVVIAALGYFVDIYDLILFGIVRDTSLSDLGFHDQAQTAMAQLLFNYQMGGMLLGGIFWGILGDRRGRISVLFGSILLYSVANILNGMVTDIHQYAVLRLVAGIGLAGELGAGVTLVVETMPRNERGWGTMVMVGIGALGAVVAAIIADYFSWRICYYIGGGLGLLLLLTRVGSYESGMFKQAKTQAAAVARGNFFALFNSRSRLRRFAACVGLALPIWFSVGILILLAKEFAAVIHITGVPTGTRIGAKAILWLYVGLASGDILAGWLSQVWRSRRRVILTYMVVLAVCIVVYLTMRNVSYPFFLFMSWLLGAATGYWGLFVTTASEQFGTNLRATVTTTVPNFARGAVIPIAALYGWCSNAFTPTHDIITGALITGGLMLAIGIWSAYSMEETFGKDLEYFEA